MTTIERRLEALEAVTPDVEPIVFLVHFEAPGRARDVSAAEVDGLKLRRRDDEAEAEFIARAKAIGLAKITPPMTGVIVLLTTEPEGVCPNGSALTVA